MMDPNLSISSKEEKSFTKEYSLMSYRETIHAVEYLLLFFLMYIINSQKITLMCIILINAINIFYPE